MQTPSVAQKIGSLAEAAGMTVDTLRYYEREGLLTGVTRTAGGFRCYSEDALRRLQFIKQARDLGLSLREIRQLVAPENARCATVRAAIVERLADVDRRLRELESFRGTLQSALDGCDEALHRSRRAVCPVAGHLGT
jgi:DNA-binding transcriptional MerR regulator